MTTREATALWRAAALQALSTDDPDSLDALAEGVARTLGGTDGVQVRVALDAVRAERAGGGSPNLAAETGWEVLVRLVWMSYGKPPQSEWERDLLLAERDAALAWLARHPAHRGRVAT
jgi:hypothetical protein